MMARNILLILATSIAMVSALAESDGSESNNESYSPSLKQVYPTNVYWGDTHLHTNLSIDANEWGKNTTLSPDDAYRFARGEAITAHNGMRAKLDRPLDFLVVADHAAGIGVIPDLKAGAEALLSTEEGRRLYQEFEVIKLISDSKEKSAAMATFIAKLYGNDPSGGKSYPLKKSSHLKSVWEKIVENADKYNEPGTFTAFSGFEWTSRGSLQGDWAGNLHRVVIFKDDANKTSKVVPFSKIDSEDPEKLWAYLVAYENKTGGDVLAIPHNGNVSNGEMFSPFDYSGNPITASYAKMRARWEPLYEVTQIKGDSEAHPLLSPSDEFADFETWNSWFGRYSAGEWDETKLRQKQSEYARSALKLGLQQKAQLGVNPFKFGMIGSTDSHTSLSTADDSNFWGKMSKDEPRPNRMFDSMIEGWAVKGWETAAAGYAAVWAEENTREYLFAAMKRKEVYASTGPRITVRFFGGWDYRPDDAFNPDMVHIGYTNGVPMGGDLTNAPENKSPSFLIRATKDPEGANLDRVQVIKGWRSKDRELHEKIYNVALSDGRVDGENGKTSPVGNTVNLADASYTNTIGDPELAVVWIDPDFKADELAFYYVRVLEIPTPRWTAYDAKFFGIKGIPKEVPMITQERAYTSAIWYSPNIR